MKPGRRFNAMRQDDRERDEQARITKVYKKLGCTVYSLSQYRGSNVSKGLPDLLVKHGPRKLSWTHELKGNNHHRPDGGLSPEQKEFRDLCLACRDLHVVGGYAAGIEFLVANGFIAEGYTP